MGDIKMKKDDGTQKSLAIISGDGVIEDHVPVEPEIRQTDITRKGEQAANIVVKYLEGVAAIYDIDVRWIAKVVMERIQAKWRTLD